jgi:hypothetical protein
MDSDADMMERHARLLGRYADQAAMLAEGLCAAAMAAETAEQKQSLTLAFHRMGRTLRQTLALEAKLRRDARRDARLDEDRADKVAQARTAARRDRVRNAVEQLIWTEAEDEQVDFLTLLNQRLDGHDLADPDEPVEALIQRVAAEIGLEVPPEASGADDDPLLSDDYWRSSA